MSARPHIIGRCSPLRAAAVLRTAGCGTPTTPTAPATPSAPGASSSANTADFTIRGYKFPPLTAAAGQRITVTAVLRAGAAESLFDGTRAPSNIGSWLRAHKWSNVRQLDAVSRELLARLWSAGGPADLAGPLTIDRYSTIVAVRRAKQGAAFRLHQGPRVPPAAGDLRADRAGADVPAARWRPWADRGAASFLTETISRTRTAGATATALRRTVFNMPGRLIHTGRRRRLRLRLPVNWPWADPIQRGLARIHAIPMRC